MKMPDKIYNILKYVLTIVVPAVIALLIGLGQLYHFDTELIIGTISLIATFVGALFGISCATYNKENK